MNNPEWYTKAKAEGRILNETGVKVMLGGDETDQLANVPTPKRPNKYGNQKTVVDGITFDSKKEANRYQELKLMEKMGSITNLELQVRYPIKVNGVLVCTYVADFAYREEIGFRWEEVVEDVKSDFTRKNPVYRIKCKLMAAALGITIREV